MLAHKLSRGILCAIACGIVGFPGIALGQSAQSTTKAVEPASIVPPQLLSEVSVSYPTQMLAKYPAGEAPSGMVELAITIDEAGRVAFAQAITYSHAEFANAATELIQSVRFEPAKMPDGTAIAVEIAIEIPFEPPVREVEADTAQISGQVYSRGSKLPLVGAIVSLAQSDAQTTTDSKGEFLLSGVPATNVTVRILAADHEIYTVREVLSAGDALQVEYFVQPKISDGLRLLVEGERERREVSRKTVTLKEIVQIPGIGQDAIKVVQILPGVAVPSDVSGDIIVRGSDARDNFLEIDGLPAPYIFHLTSIASVLSTFAVDRIDFYPSNFSARYGNAIGGAILVESREPDNDVWRGSVNVGTLLAEGYAEGPVTDNVGVYVGVRRSYFDAILKAALPDNTGLNLTTAPQFYDYQSKITYDPADGHKLSLFVNGANDRVALLFDEDQLVDPESFQNFSISQGFHQGRIRYTYTPNERLYNRFMLGAGSQNIQFDVDEGALKFKLFTDTLRLRDELRYQFESETTLRVGGQLDISRIRTDILAPRPPRQGEFDYDFFTAERQETQQTQAYRLSALYGELEQKLWDRLSLIGGLRASKLNLAPYWLVDPRFGSRLEVGETTMLKASVGLYQQYPEVQDFIAEAGGNPVGSEPGAERSIHYLLGLEQEIPGGFLLTVEGYYKDMLNLLRQVDDILADVRLVNNAQGRAYGVEILVKKEFTDKWFGWLSYSYSRSQRREPGGDWSPSEFDQPHIFNGLLTYAVTRGWRVGARYRYASGNPEYSTNDALFYADQLDYIRVRSPIRNQRQPSYQRLDVRTDYTWLLKKAKITAYVEVLNVYLHENPVGDQQAYDFSSKEYLYSFPILPNFGVKADF